MSGPLVGVVDYGRGNLRSVEKALEAAGARPLRLAGPEGMERCAALVLPGVGAFGDGMVGLRQRGFEEPLKGWLEEGRYFLGICLGCQLLFESSEESPGVKGLGFLPGRVMRFDSSRVAKIPHIGWNQIFWSSAEGSAGHEPRHAVFGGMPEGTHFYFVHSFYPAPDEQEDVVAWSDYGGRFAAAVGRGRAVATQFHPEKSQAAGLVLLRNFVKWVEGERDC